jgi:hypothetical protein
MNKKIIGIFVCMLFMFQLGVVVSAENNSDYNLKIKISDSRLHIHHGYFTLHVKVSNEGPDTSDNYTYKVELCFLFSYQNPIKDWFWWMGTYHSYTGLRLAAGSNEFTSVDFLNNLPQGCYIAKATLNHNDNNHDDDVSNVVFWVNYD